MRVTVKICGLTNAADAGVAAREGADFLGFVFFPVSRRCVGPSAASWIRVLGGAAKVGVFRDQDERTIRQVREDATLDLVQLHGSESPEMCEALGGRERVVKAISVGRAVDWARVAEYARVARVLFDTDSKSGGGTGRLFDWRLLAEVPADLGFWLAGGLTPENVAGAVARVGPAGVDVASGVEDPPGRKDPDKVRRFIAAVRGVRRFEGSNVQTFKGGPR